jgi:ribosomal-protein-alanine N-acetyltransferase
VYYSLTVQQDMKLVRTFSTNRLIATCLRREDFDDLHAMHQDPKVMLTLGGLRSDAQTRRYLQDNITQWKERGYGLWTFRDKRDNRFIGRGGLRKIIVEGNGEIEVAYAVITELWGKGFATEMARGSLNVAFQRLGFREIVALTLPTNQASRRVMEKAGLRYERDIIHAGLPHVLYRVKSEECG